MRASIRKSILDNGSSFAKTQRQNAQDQLWEKEFFNMAEAMVWAGWNHFCAIGENSGLNQ